MYDSAILFYTWNDQLNGSILNAFEIFFCSYEYNKDIKLIFVNSTPNYIDHFIRTVEDRYLLNDIKGYKENIISISLKHLIRMRFGTVLVLDFGSTPKFRGLLSAKKLLAISESLPDQKEYIFPKELYNVIYYGEMPFHHRDVNYRMKFLFDRYKPLQKVETAIYINSPNNKDYSFIKKLNLPDKKILYKGRIHVENLFEKFDEYVYYHANKWFDPHPRFILECAFYKKKLHYYNSYNIKDGSWYRWKDYKENGLKDRTLTKDDEIVRQLI